MALRESSPFSLGALFSSLTVITILGGKTQLDAGTLNTTAGLPPPSDIQAGRLGTVK